MHVRVLGCSGAELPGYKTTCFMVGGSLLVDAGAITSVLTPEEQQGITDILVTHSHLDHVKDIPLLADNIVGAGSDPVNIISSGKVIKILREHLFNNRLWPDFSRVPSPESPVIRFREITPGIPFKVGALTVTAVEVNHTVPTVGYIIGNNDSSFAVSGDTGPTDELWEMINSTENIGAVFLETSFPNGMEEIARISGHLTPDMMAGELKKLANDRIPVYLYHMKPNFLNTLEEQISAVDRRGLVILESGDTVTI